MAARRDVWNWPGRGLPEHPVYYRAGGINNYVIILPARGASLDLARYSLGLCDCWASYPSTVTVSPATADLGTEVQFHDGSCPQCGTGLGGVFLNILYTMGGVYIM